MNAFQSIQPGFSSAGFNFRFRWLSFVSDSAGLVLDSAVVPIQQFWFLIQGFQFPIIGV